MEMEEDEDSDEDYVPIFRNRLRARRLGEPARLPPVPNPEGVKLMGQGDFGTNQYYVDRLKKRKRGLSTSLIWREMGIDNHGVQKRADQSISQVRQVQTQRTKAVIKSKANSFRPMIQGLIPGSAADRIIHYDTRSYSGQFSDDGNFFFCCAQDFKVRMYDTSNPYDWKYYKTVDYPFGQWTITDATLSPDNRFLVYSSIRSQAYMASTDPEDDSDPSVLDFSALPGQGRRRGFGTSHFGVCPALLNLHRLKLIITSQIWSLRFSGDGREVVAGTSEDSVIVYDLETKQPVLNLRDRHQHHVNAVCYGDSSSPHILYSGSDDTPLRVWDRRSMGDGREAGAFMGHTEGLTYVDSKGDGRYVLSNSKDQTMKLWDLRKMMTSADIENIDPAEYTTGFDYRFEPYPDAYRTNAKSDCSVVTFQGHRVLKTLIRCHFSPPGSTNSRYVYSGSEDGKVYVYNMDATLNSRPREPDAYATAYEMSGEMLWRTCVRDASWHPNAPVLAGKH
jgi:WD repeat-containing protein 23